MKHFILLVSVVILFLVSISCNTKGNKQEITQDISLSNVNVLYFHFTRRCATCLAVEETARKAVEALFPNEVATGEYKFIALNLDEASTKKIADELAVGGQTLLVISGDKKVDITGAAWLAAHDPDKMKAEIKSGIDKVLF